MAPVSVEALALKAMALPLVALRRSPPLALAIVLLKLMVAVDGSAKIKSPDALVMLKLSKVATALVALVKSIALPAADTVPPPEATIDGEAPLKRESHGGRLRSRHIERPRGRDRARVACTPVEVAPETVMDVGASVVIAPPVAANRPVFELPLSPMFVAPVSVTVLPEPLASTPPAPASPLTTRPRVGGRNGAALGGVERECGAVDRERARAIESDRGAGALRPRAIGAGGRSGGCASRDVQCSRDRDVAAVARSPRGRWRKVRPRPGRSS